MFLAVKDPIFKLIEVGDEVDAYLGYGLVSFIALIPLVTLAFFFYEKRITRTGNIISIFYRVYGITVFKENFTIKDNSSLHVEHFMDSPNVARMNGGEDAAGFQNKGYFVLWLTSIDGKKIALDRHSRKVDVEKLLSLLKLVGN